MAIDQRTGRDDTTGAYVPGGPRYDRNGYPLTQYNEDADTYLHFDLDGNLISESKSPAYPLDDAGKNRYGTAGEPAYGSQINGFVTLPDGTRWKRQSQSLEEILAVNPKFESDLKSWGFGPQDVRYDPKYGYLFSEGLEKKLEKEHPANQGLFNKLVDMLPGAFASAVTGGITGGAFAGMNPLTGASFAAGESGLLGLLAESGYLPSSLASFPGSTMYPPSTSGGGIFDKLKSLFSSGTGAEGGALDPWVNASGEWGVNQRFLDPYDLTYDNGFTTMPGAAGATTGASSTNQIFSDLYRQFAGGQTPASTQNIFGDLYKQFAGPAATVAGLGASALGAGGGEDEAMKGYQGDVTNAQIQEAVRNGTITAEEAAQIGALGGSGNIGELIKKAATTLAGGTGAAGGATSKGALGALANMLGIDEDLLKLVGGAGLLGAGALEDPDRTTTKSSTISLPGWYEEASKKALGQADLIAGMGGDLVAPLSENERRAGALAGSSAGAWRPYLDKSAAYADEAAAPITATDLERYMNPYLESTLAPIERKHQQAMAGRYAAADSQAGMKNAFGTSRSAIEKSLLTEAGDAELNRIRSDGYKSAYDFAVSQASADRARKANAGTAYSGLGTTSSALTGADVTRLNTTGGLEREVDQAKRATPLTAIKAYTGALPAKVGQTTTSTETGPAGSKLGQLTGALTALAGL